MGVGSLWSERVGVAPEGGAVDHQGFTIWPSTEPDLLLVLRKTLLIAVDPTSGGLRAGLVLHRERQVGGETLTTGGTFELTFQLNAPPTREEAEDFVVAWQAAAGCEGPDVEEKLPRPYRLAALPTWDYQTRVIAGPEWGEATVEVGEGESPSQATLHVKLDSGAAARWQEAIERPGTQTAPPGGIEIRYSYLRLLPETIAHIHVNAAALYDAFAGPSCEESLTWDEIETVWQRLHATGDITVTLSEPLLEAEPLPDAEPELEPEPLYASLEAVMLQQALMALFDELFEPSVPATTPLTYVWRGEGTSAAEDLALSIEVVGWSWLAARREVALAELVAPLNRDHIRQVLRETTFPASFTVHGHPLVQTVSVAWSASEGAPPQSPVFGPEGGTETYLVTSQDPDAVEIRYRATVSFRPGNWPLIERQGRQRVADGGHRIALDPGSWLAGVQVYLYRRDGDHVRPFDTPAENDSIVVNFTYTGPHLSVPIRISERITPQRPLEFQIPRDPEGQPGQATVGCYGVLDGRMVRVREEPVDLDAGPVFLLYDENRLQVVTSHMPIAESDRAARRLVAASARPAVHRHRPQA